MSLRIISKVKRAIYKVAQNYFNAGLRAEARTHVYDTGDVLDVVLAHGGVGCCQV